MTQTRCICGAGQTKTEREGKRARGTYAFLGEDSAIYQCFPVDLQSSTKEGNRSHHTSPQSEPPGAKDDKTSDRGSYSTWGTQGQSHTQTRGVSEVDVIKSSSGPASKNPSRLRRGQRWTRAAQPEELVHGTEGGGAGQHLQEVELGLVVRASLDRLVVAFALVAVACRNGNGAQGRTGRLSKRCTAVFCTAFRCQDPCAPKGMSRRQTFWRQWPPGCPP